MVALNNEMPSIDKASAPLGGGRRKRQRARRSIDISMVEDLCSDVGKTLHTKDGQVFATYNKI